MERIWKIVVNIWSAKNVLGWHEILIGDGWRTWTDGKYQRAIGSWNPCADLNDTKMVVDRLDCEQAEKWAGVLLTLPDAPRYNKAKLLNSPPDSRMEAVINVFFPGKTTEEAIQEMEKSYAN